MHDHGGFRPNAGRRAGTPNRITQEIRELLRPLNERAVARLGALLESTDDTLAFKACELVLAYGFGRPRAAVDIDIEPKQQAISPEELEHLNLSDEQLRRLAGI